MFSVPWKILATLVASLCVGGMRSKQNNGTMMQCIGASGAQSSLPVLPYTTEVLREAAVATVIPGSADSLESEIFQASRIDWGHFKWQEHCLKLHHGMYKIVCQLKSYPRVAVASIRRCTGDVIEEEVRILNELEANGVRTVAHGKEILDVPFFNPECDQTSSTKGYLLQYFDKDSCFLFVDGEPGTEDYFVEPMRKLQLVEADGGDWQINHDTIRILQEHHLERVFMQDLTAIVKLMLDTGHRIGDFQGVLGRDGHFYVADPLSPEPIHTKVNRHLMKGIFTSSQHPKRQNKKLVGFVDALGVELGVSVPDIEK